VVTDKWVLPSGAAAGLVAPGATPAVPRDAATVVLLRDTGTGSGPEVYLLRRVSTMAFAAGMYVFPGGRVDPADSGDDIGWVGPSAHAWAEPLSAGVPLARALVCAAVRETFEECGVLLAGRDASSVVDVSDPEWEADRQALLARETSLSDLLRARGLLLRADLLRPWARWITPEAEPRRYDTRFLVAALPPLQNARHVGGEADHAAWLTPAAALRQHRDGELAMLPPTVVTLEQIDGLPSAAAVLSAADDRTVQTVQPRIEIVDGQAAVVLTPDGGTT